MMKSGGGEGMGVEGGVTSPRLHLFDKRIKKSFPSDSIISFNLIAFINDTHTLTHSADILMEGSSIFFPSTEEKKKKTHQPTNEAVISTDD